MVVRQAPYSQRSARTQLDVALAAATLELPLELYFLGDAVWQLASARNNRDAGLPGGLKGWGALAQMTEVKFFGEADEVRLLESAGADTTVSLVSMDLAEMASRWRHCKRVMAI